MKPELALDMVDVDLLCYIVEAFVEDNQENTTSLPPETARAARKILKRFAQFTDTKNQCGALGPQCRACKDYHSCHVHKATTHFKHIGICKHKPVTWTGDHSAAYEKVLTKVFTRKAG